MLLLAERVANGAKGRAWGEFIKVFPCFPPAPAIVPWRWFHLGEGFVSMRSFKLSSHAKSVLLRRLLPLLLHAAVFGPGP